MQTFDSELVSGSITRSVWKLAWPVVLTQLVAGIHGFIDQILVGNFVGSDGNAGIGVAWQMFLVVVVFIASLFQGMGVMIARYAGRQDKESISRVAYDTFLASLYILIFVTAPLGYVLSPSLLVITNAEPQVQEHALPYLRILFTCSAPLFLMFMLNGALQASGNARTPLFLGIVTTILNVVLSMFFIVVLDMGAAGAALGTVLGPVPSVCIVLHLVLSGRLILSAPARFYWRPDFKILKTAARIGIPTGIQAVLLNIGGVMLLRFIGALEHSAEAQAAYTICYTQLFSFVTWVGFGLRAASSSLIGQNMGAGNTERGKHAVYVAAAYGGVWAVGLGLIYWFIPESLLALFDADEGPVVELGVEFLKFLAFSGLFLIGSLAITGGLQGAGDTTKPMYIAFVSQIVILLGYCWILDSMGLLSSTAIWSAILISHSTRFLFTLFFFRRGSWEHINVEIGA